MKRFISALALAATLALPGAAVAQNARLTANFGEIQLTAGFTPDPYRVNLTAGGSIDAYLDTDLPGSCVGEISNADGTLSVNATLQEAAAPGWGCGRALAHQNNIVIDVNTCSADPADSAVRIAKQLADKVTARW